MSPPPRSFLKISHHHSPRYVLVHRMKYRWGRVKRKRFTLTKNRKMRIRKYLLQYETALRQEANGTHVNVYMDESYIHQNHAWEYTLHPENDNEIEGKTGKGKRLIIVHAITKHGPLQMPDAIDNSYTLQKEQSAKKKKKKQAGPKEEVERPDFAPDIRTCEYIYEAGRPTGDYHLNMDGDMFIKWIEERLIPTFDAFCMEKFKKKKKMNLILDNAPYHHAHDHTTVHPSTLSKKGCIAKLAELGLDKVPMKINRGGQLCEFTSAVWAKTAGPTAKHGPYVKEIQDELKSRLINSEEHKNLLSSRVQNIFDSTDHVLIFTPPYSPDLQPIELFWANGKNFVASNYFEGRNLQQCLEYLRIGWYGGEYKQDHNGEQRTREACSCLKLVQHCIERANVRVAADGGLGGTVDGGLTTKMAIAKHFLSGMRQMIPLKPPRTPPRISGRMWMASAPSRAIVDPTNTQQAVDVLPVHKPKCTMRHC